MSEKITVPTLGESVTEATVSKWLKSKGEKVIADEPIVELETDKVNVEVPAPSNGVLGTIDVKEGETVNVGSLLGTINESNINLKLDEEKSYNPPKKQPKLFDDKKKTAPALSSPSMKGYYQAIFRMEKAGNWVMDFEIDDGVNINNISEQIEIFERNKKLPLSVFSR